MTTLRFANEEKGATNNAKQTFLQKDTSLIGVPDSISIQNNSKSHPKPH